MPSVFVCVLTLASQEEEKPKKKGGYQAQLQLSEEFGAFLGAETMSRTEIVKQMWVYFKEKDLQNPKDRRQILLDEPRQAIFKVKKFTMFSMNKVRGGFGRLGVEGQITRRLQFALLPPCSRTRVASNGARLAHKRAPCRQSALQRLLNRVQRNLLANRAF